jgi:hypothetical protein
MREDVPGIYLVSLVNYSVTAPKLNAPRFEVQTVFNLDKYYMRK